jgi:hypothetical protein
VAAGSSSMCRVAISMLLGALCCVCMRSVRGMFMSVVFIYCIIRGFFGVVINFTHLLIQYCVQQGIEKKAFPPQSQSAPWAAGSL